MLVGTHCCASLRYFIMNIQLNGQTKTIEGIKTLKGLISTFAKNPDHVIAEVNGTIVKTPQWEETSLNEGDTIELISFVGGG